MNLLGWWLVIGAVAWVAYFLGGMRGYLAGWEDGVKEGTRQTMELFP